MQSNGEWKRELMFVKRDKNGVIIGLSELTPAGYVDPIEKEITDATRFHVAE